MYPHRIMRSGHGKSLSIILPGNYNSKKEKSRYQKKSHRTFWFSDAKLNHLCDSDLKALWIVSLRIYTIG